MMKILYYTDSQTFGGAEKYLILLLKNLPEEVIPFVVCHKSQKGLISELENLKINYSTIAAPSKIYFWQIFSLKKLFKKIKPEMIHFQFWSPYSGFFGLLAARMAGIKKIISTEHSLVRLSSANFWQRPFKKWYLRYRNQVTDIFITPSFASKKMMAKDQGFNANKVVTIHNGIPKNLPESSGEIDSLLKLAGKKIVVGTIARLEEGKGHLPYLEAIKKILKQREDLLFVFVGGGSLLEKLKAQSSKLKLDNHVYFAGEQKNVYPYLKLFDIFAFPSLSENFPYAILEAMKVSLPVVAFKIGGISEQIEENKNGYLVGKGDFQRFGEALLWLSGNQPLRAKMGASSQELFLNNFTIEKSVDETIEVYKRI